MELTAGVAALLVASVLLAAKAADDAPKPLESPTMEWKVFADVGYRGLSVDGSEELFRSHTNLHEGVRLFGLNLRGTPKGSTSRFMDSIEINSAGLGGDPQEWFNFTMRKRGAYRWDARFNQNDYFFDVPDFTRFGQHTNDNHRRTFDTLLELNPGSSRVYVGYTRREFSGLTFLTQDEARDEFQIFLPVDRRTNEARAGIDLKAGSWDLSFEEMYRKLDSLSDFELAPGGGAGNSNANATLTSFTRDLPLEGRYWVSRGSAHAAFADRVDLSVRFVYSDGKTDGSSAQSAAGTWFTTGAPAFTETVDAGFHSTLPSSLAEAGVSIRLTDRVYVNNNFRYQDYRIDGNTDEVLVRAGASPTTTDQTFERVTDWNSWEGRSEVEWRVNRRWTLRGGYRRFERSVTTEETDTDNVAATSTIDREKGDQASNTFIGSATLRWAPKWTAFLELQDGQVDNVFLRVDPAKFRLARLRGTYKPTERWAFSLSTVLKHSENPNPSVENRVDSRSYAISADFTGKRLFLSTGYTAVYLDSATDIVFCVGSPCFTGSVNQVTDISTWDFENSHYFANVTYKFSDRFKGALRGQMTDSRGTFPVDYYFVEPRFSVRMVSGFWFNVGAYRYRFDRDQDNTQDYRAEGILVSFSGDF